MGRPFRTYCMSLCERLGYRSLKELYATLDNNEIFEWMAYDKLQDKDFTDQVKKEIALEEQKSYSREQEAEAMRALFNMFT